MHIDDLARVLRDELGLLQKLSVIAVGHETNLHALFLVGGLEIALAGDGAGIGLRQFSERENRLRELPLLQRKKEVALVLAPVLSAFEQCAACVAALFRAREMAGRNKFRSELPRAG